jgi:hypothetical protein
MFNDDTKEVKGSKITQKEKDYMDLYYNGSTKSVAIIAEELGRALATVYYWTNHNGYRDRMRAKYKRNALKKKKRSNVNPVKVENKLTSYTEWLIKKDLLKISGEKAMVISLLVNAYKSSNN